VESLKLKFQPVAEKTAKNFRGYFILPQMVHTRSLIVSCLFQFLN